MAVVRLAQWPSPAAACMHQFQKQSRHDSGQETPTCLFAAVDHQPLQTGAVSRLSLLLRCQNCHTALVYVKIHHHHLQHQHHHCHHYHHTTASTIATTSGSSCSLPFSSSTCCGRERELLEISCRFLWAKCPSCHPTNTVKALKGT